MLQWEVRCQQGSSIVPEPPWEQTLVRVAVLFWIWRVFVCALVLEVLQFEYPLLCPYCESSCAATWDDRPSCSGLGRQRLLRLRLRPTDCCCEWDWPSYPGWTQGHCHESESDPLQLQWPTPRRDWRWVLQVLLVLRLRMMQLRAARVVCVE